MEGDILSEQQGYSLCYLLGFQLRSNEGEGLLVNVGWDGHPDTVHAGCLWYC